MPVLQISCLLGFITCIGSLQTSLIKGVGKSMWILKYQCAQQILTILIAILFSPQGPTVVMAMITIKTFLVWPFTIFYITKLLSISVFSYLRNLFKPFVSGAVLVCVFYLLKVLLDPSIHICLWCLKFLYVLFSIYCLFSYLQGARSLLCFLG